MSSQSFAGFLAAVIGAIVLAAAFYYVPVGPIGKPGRVAAPVAVQAAPAPADAVPATPPARGSVVKDVPN